MGKVKDKILGDAAEKVRELKDEYLQKEESLRAVYEEGLKNSEMENEKKLKSLYDSEVRRLLAVRKLELRKNILSAKREIIRQLAESVKERIQGDPALYKKFIEKAVQSGVKTGTEEIAVSRRDRELFNNEFMRHLNLIASEMIGGEPSLRLADDEMDIEGGVYLRHGREKFNASVTVSVESAVYELEPELAVILFGGEN